MLVQGKRTRISHKTHNMVRVAEDDWIIVEDRHKAIIKETIFNQVQDIIYNRNVRVNKKGVFYKYTGFLKCINNHIELINEVESKIKDIVSFSKIEYNSEIKKIRKAEIEIEKSKYKKLLDGLVKDYKCDFISEKDFDEFKEKYLFEINRLNIEIEELDKEKLNSYNLEWLENFKNIKNR